MSESSDGVVSQVFGAYYNLYPLPALQPLIRATLRGKLRLAKERPEHASYRHLIMVGDRVRFSVKENEGVIETLLPRKNELLRVSSFEMHALGANIDRAVLVVSLASPPPRFPFIDRFLASCYAGGVEPILAFTKFDLIEDPEESEAIEMAALYRKLGYTTFVMNLLEPQTGEFPRFRDAVENGETLFAGNSGTGKSTLINCTLGSRQLKTGTISSATQKGRHTTTNSVLIPRENGACLIDTPGVKEWGILHLDRKTVFESFPELRPFTEQCRFRNCNHEEKQSGCRVQEAIFDSLESDEPVIEPRRIQSLYSLLDSLSYSERIRTGDYIKPTGRFRS